MFLYVGFNIPKPVIYRLFSIQSKGTKDLKLLISKAFHSDNFFVRVDSTRTKKLSYKKLLIKLIRITV